MSAFGLLGLKRKVCFIGKVAPNHLFGGIYPAFTRNISYSTSHKQFVTREGEAPAEPWRRRLGRSLALPPILPSFQGSALERTAFEAPPRVIHAFTTEEAGASGAFRPQAEPGDEGQR